jgi:hypothetical protein
MFNLTKPSSNNNVGFRLLLLSIMIATITLLSACGSTKVYTNDKTIVYRGAIYNLSTVKQVGTEITAKLADDKIIDITQADKSRIQSLLEENGSFFATMSFKLDTDDMPYRANTIKKYSDYSRMKSDFESAQKKIVKLMGDKKKNQLKLK